MKKYLSIVALSLICGASASADEGMWLPSLISQRIGDMQAKGFTLTAEDIYSINQASLKDAVVLFGGGCTGELISPEGLLLTNHHCGYGQIQRHSSVEHDYLRDGFWAMTRAEELPNPGLSVSFLEYMEDVTEQVLEGYDESMTEQEREALVDKNSAKLVEEATAAGNGLRASVEPLFRQLDVAPPYRRLLHLPHLRRQGQQPRSLFRGQCALQTQEVFPHSRRRSGRG